MRKFKDDLTSNLGEIERDWLRRTLAIISSIVLGCTVLPIVGIIYGLIEMHQLFYKEMFMYWWKGPNKEPEKESV